MLHTLSHSHTTATLAQVLDDCDTQDEVKVGVVEKAMRYILETFCVSVLCTSERQLNPHGAKSEEIKPLSRQEVCVCQCRCNAKLVGDFASWACVE